MNDTDSAKDTVNYANEVHKMIESHGISAYSYSLATMSSKTNKILKSAEIQFKDHSLETMEENIKLLAEAGIKIVDYHPDIDHFLVYANPGSLNKIKKSEAVAKFDLVMLEHGPTKMFKM